MTHTVVYNTNYRLNIPSTIHVFIVFHNYTFLGKTNKHYVHITITVGLIISLLFNFWENGFGTQNSFVHQTAHYRSWSLQYCTAAGRYFYYSVKICTVNISNISITAPFNVC